MQRISQQDFGRLVLSYLVNVLLFSLAIVFFRTSRYYTGFLSPQTQQTLLTFFLFYLFAAIPLELLLPPHQRRLQGKGLIALRAVLRFVRDGAGYLSRFPLDQSRVPHISREEKTAILFLLVKFYYLPVMVNFVFANWNNIVWSWGLFPTAATIHQLLLGATVPFISALFLFVDTAFFVFGYSVEYPAASNQVRSVEPTLFGWAIALICYPPFNSLLDYFIVWPVGGGGVPTTSGALLATYAMQIVAMLALLLYLLPTLALGTKCSNLTNRGIVTRGPYAYIRHPAYTGKLIGWWVTSIPFFLQPGKFLLGVLSMGVWTMIYFFRALTEERHLIADPEYQEYCRNVRWRFIPYVL